MLIYGIEMGRSLPLLQLFRVGCIDLKRFDNLKRSGNPNHRDKKRAASGFAGILHHSAHSKRTIEDKHTTTTVARIP